MKDKIYNYLKDRFQKEYAHKLQDKTVMFPLKEVGFNYSRLDHTEDVKNIALDIFGAFSNKIENENIDSKDVEIAALYHDVGHCPYGHAGEETLNKLLSQDDNNNFKYSFYSGYKHNLLSAIILLKECKENVPAGVVDAVLKHSSTQPKNFIANIAKTHNIFTLNYIFRLDHETLDNIITHKDWYRFIDKYNIKKECNNCKKYKKTKKSTLISCSFNDFESKFNHYLFMARTEKNKTQKCNYNITNYLLYPYPDTILGYIIKNADEISCFANDLYYFGIYINSKENNDDDIIQKQINDIITDIINYVDASKEAKSLAYLVESILSNKTTPELRLEIKKHTIKFLIKNLAIYYGNRCQYIESKKQKKYMSISFNKSINDVFWIIKGKIYSIIHKLNVIQKANNKGAKMLEDAFKYYINNFDIFFEISKQNKNECEDYIRKITDIKKINNNLFLNCKTINDFMQKLPINKNHQQKIENAYRRQVIFYIAKLCETDIINLLAKNKLELN